MNFSFEIAPDKEEEAVGAQTKEKENYAHNVNKRPLDISISFRYLFSDTRTEQFYQTFTMKGKRNRNRAERAKK